jgi:ABC-type transporter Mla subunit MlaD
MPRHPVRNRVVAGAFLLVMLAAGLAILVVIGGWQTWFEARQTLRVRFDAAPNIKIGSPVLLAGHPVGRVVDIELVEAPCPVEYTGDDKCYKVEVVTELPEAFRICQNARVTIAQALVGQSALINIEDVGFGDPVKGALPGRQQSPFAGAADELGLGTKEKKDLSSILDNIRTTTDSIRKDLPEVIEKVKATAANLEEGSKSVQTAATKINGILDENRDNVKAAVANAKSLSEKADQKGGEVLDNLKAASGDVKAILDENRADLRKTVTQAGELMAKVNANADEILANVKATSGDLLKTVKDIREVVVIHKKNITTMVQNLHETSEHLKALAKEVRRSPWRLFKEPDKQEVESINLYEAARDFASAASDLDSLADTLQVMSGAEREGFEIDQELRRAIEYHLGDAFQKYRGAENALMEEFKRIQK